ncbi:hypothetical protein D1007_42033 [Hordeum vulgare]|nr:hypothetical protein D1007_42033 [Hordeum vulgare]
MALSAAGDVAIPEEMEEEVVVAFPPELVGASWGWSCTAPEMAQAVGAMNWCLTPPRSPEREEVLQDIFQPAPRMRDRRPTSGRCRPTSTSSATATTTTPATSEDGDDDGDNGPIFSFMLIMSNWAVLWS